MGRIFQIAFTIFVAILFGPALSAVLGRMDELATAYGLLGSYNTVVWSFFQDKGQLDRLYGDDASVMMSSSRAVQVFAVSDESTVSYVQDMLGRSAINAPSSLRGGTEVLPLREAVDIRKEVGRKQFRQYILRDEDAPMILERVEYFRAPSWSLHAAPDPDYGYDKSPWIRRGRMLHQLWPTFKRTVPETLRECWDGKSFIPLLGLMTAPKTWNDDDPMPGKQRAEQDALRFIQTVLKILLGLAALVLVGVAVFFVLPLLWRVFVWVLGVLFSPVGVALIGLALLIRYRRGVWGWIKPRLDAFKAWRARNAAERERREAESHIRAEEQAERRRLEMLARVESLKLPRFWWWGQKHKADRSDPDDQNMPATSSLLDKLEGMKPGALVGSDKADRTPDETTPHTGTRDLKNPSVVSALGSALTEEDRAIKAKAEEEARRRKRRRRRWLWIVLTPFLLLGSCTYLAVYHPKTFSRYVVIPILWGGIWIIEQFEDDTPSSSGSSEQAPSEEQKAPPASPAEQRPSRDSLNPERPIEPQQPDFPSQPFKVPPDAFQG